MLVIAPTKGRALTHWSQMNWTGVEANVRRLQSRSERAAAHGEQAQGKNRHKRMVRSGSAPLLASRQVPQDHSGTQTPGVDGGGCETPQQRLARLHDGLSRKGDRPTPVTRHDLPKHRGGRRP